MEFHRRPCNKSHANKSNSKNKIYPKIIFTNPYKIKWDLLHHGLIVYKTWALKRRVFQKIH